MKDKKKITRNSNAIAYRGITFLGIINEITQGDLRGVEILYIIHSLYLDKHAWARSFLFKSAGHSRDKRNLMRARNGVTIECNCAKLKG